MQVPQTKTLFIRLKYFYERRLVPARFLGNDPPRRRARYLNATCQIVIPALGIFLVVNCFSYSLLHGESLILAMALGMAVLLYVALWRGKMAFAEFGLIALFYATITISIINLGTIRTPTTALYTGVIIVAGWLYGTRGLTISMMLSSLSVLALIGAENARFLPPPNYAVGLTQGLTYITIFGSISIFNILGLRDQQQAHASADRELAERKRLEHVLQTERDLAFQIMNTMGQGLVVVNAAQRITYVNPAYAKMVGYTPEKLIGQASSDYIHPDDLAINIHHRAERELGHTITDELRLQRKDGSSVHVLVTSAPRWQDDQFIGMVDVGTDLTERIQAEQALRESEARFRMMADATPMLIWMSDTNQLYNYFNQTWLTYRGRTLEQEMGNGWTEGVHPDDVARCLEIYAMAYARRESFQMEYRLRRHTGEYGWILDTGVPRQSPTGQFVGYIGTGLDITERKQILAQAAEHQHALAIVEEREKIARELHDGVVQVIGYIHLQTSTALEQLTSQQISLAEATLSNIRDIALDAHADIHDFILGLRIGEKSVTGFFPALEHYLEQFQANYHLPVTLSKPAVWHDGMIEPNVQVRLLRMIQEALTNTQKHAHASSVRVTFTLPGNMVQVIVGDDGCGFTPLPLERRKPSKTTAHFGLAMMTQRVAEINGILEIRSVIGQGTQVIIQVPRAIKTPVRMSGLRVLVADDQRLFREGLNTLLTVRGVQVVGIAANGQEALEQTRQLKPDLVLLDVVMPEMDGIVALKRIKAEMPETKVVLLTDFAEQPVFDAINAGANGYLLKTISPRELYDMLERVARGEILISPDLAARVMQNVATPVVDIELKPRHKKILELIAQGKTNKEIGNALMLTEAGVKYHLQLIFERLGVTTRDEAVTLARKRGWL